MLHAHARTTTAPSRPSPPPPLVMYTTHVQLRRLPPLTPALPPALPPPPPRRRHGGVPPALRADGLLWDLQHGAAPRHRPEEGGARATALMRASERASACSRLCVLGGNEGRVCAFACVCAQGGGAVPAAPACQGVSWIGCHPKGGWGREGRCRCGGRQGCQGKGKRGGAYGLRSSPASLVMNHDSYASLAVGTIISEASKVPCVSSTGLYI